MADIPVIDFSGYANGPADKRATIARDIVQASRQVGFLYLTNIGIPPSHISRMFDLMQRYFSQPADVKERHPYTSAAANHGYNGLGSEKLNPQKPGDLKETFTMKNVEATAPNLSLWPSAGFRDETLAFFRACRSAAHRVLEAFALALGAAPDFFTRAHSGQNQTLRFLHYPAVQSALPGQIGAGAHTDYGTITLLFQDDLGGLYVQRADGVWIEAPPKPGTVIVNTGDLMARWTNNFLRSTPHQVRPRFNPDRPHRYSIAFFCDPDDDTLIECLPSCTGPDTPPQFAPITARDHITQKIVASLQSDTADA